MLSSLSTGLTFLQFFALGAVLGLSCLGVKLLCFIFKHNIIITNTAYFVFFSICGIVFCGLTYKLLSGQVFFYTIFACVLGFILEQITLSNFFTKLFKWVYNNLIKLFSRAKSTKAGAKLLK